MKLLVRILFASLSFQVSTFAFDGELEIPLECRQETRIIALLDCLQNHQDLLEAVLNYQRLLIEIEQAKSKRTEANYTPPPTNDSKVSEALATKQWFEKNLLVYDIVGTEPNLTAHARLNQREYRLQKGDTIRTAIVMEVFPRGLELAVGDFQFLLGLSATVSSE